MAENWFKKLSAVDVSGHVEKKNGLNYLSWMWAWSELKKLYPLSYSTVHETAEGGLVWKDPNGCHVKTSITLVWVEDGVEHEHTVTEYLPCMDMRNKSIAYDAIDSMQINKTIQRSLTKCIARLGLGSYLYMKEDLPEEVTAVAEAIDNIRQLVGAKCGLSENAKALVAKYCKEAEAKANTDFTDDMITGDYRNITDIDILTALERKLKTIKG